jgi:Heat induced stress protein YflT
MSQSDSPVDATPQDTTGRTVVGIFSHRSAAEAAIRDLRDAGFGDERIGIAMQERVEQGDLLEDAGGASAEGAAKGAVSGGLVGGLVGLLGSLLIPGLGPVLAGGVLASTLAGVGLGAATGGILGALMGLGVPEEDAKHFDQGFREGGTLVTVDAGVRTPEALAILSRHEVDLGPGGYARYGERRIGLDPAYAGPERRLVGV